MSEMIKTAWKLELAASVYASLLLAWVEESRPDRWSLQGRFLYFWDPHAISLRESNFVVFYIELFLVPTVALYFLLRLADRVASVRVVVRAIMGAVAVAGFPIAGLIYIWRSGDGLVAAAIELVMATICLVLWVQQKWLVSDAPSTILLTLHCIFWFFFAGGLTLFGQSGPREVWNYVWLVVPAIGFSYTLAWASLFRATRK